MIRAYSQALVEAVLIALFCASVFLASILLAAR